MPSGPMTDAEDRLLLLLILDLGTTVSRAKFAEIGARRERNPDVLRSVPVISLRRLRLCARFFHLRQTIPLDSTAISVSILSSVAHSLFSLLPILRSLYNHCSEFARDGTNLSSSQDILYPYDMPADWTPETIAAMFFAMQKNGGKQDFHYVSSLMPASFTEAACRCVSF